MTLESMGRSHGEGHARREIGFNQAGDHIRAGALGRHHQVNANGSRHLRQSHQAVFGLFWSAHHQIGQFIHDHDDLRQARLPAFLCPAVVSIYIA